MIELYDYTYKSNGIDIDTVVYYHFTYYGGGIYPYLSGNPDALLSKTPQTKTVYTYNSYGQMLSTVTYPAFYSGDTVVVDAHGRVASSNQYQTSSGSAIFGALICTVDSLSRITRYYYDTANGRLLACVNQNEGNGICYTYDAIGNMTSVMPASYVSAATYTPIETEETVTYVYDENTYQLYQISTGSTTYTFNYDSFGNADSILAGNRELAGYAYNAYNGKLNAVNYGNGFSVRYVYDRLDNLKEVWYTEGENDEVKAYEYTYTTSGQLCRYDNLLTGKSTVYKYNTAGNLVQFVEYDADERVSEFASNLYYNDLGQVSSLFYHMDYAAGGSTEQWTHRYYHAYTANGKLNYFTVSTDVTGGEIDYSYDSFQRLTSRVYDFYVSGDSGKRFTNTVTYGYSTYLNCTSSQVGTVSSQVNNGTALTYSYTYDGSGNITKIALSNGTEYRYVYDDLGQLLREDNTAKSRTYVYTYDNAGNILNKKEYALTAAGTNPTTLYQTYTYGYQDTAGWGDLLTSYNGSTVTYDEIGNPIKVEDPGNYGNEIFMEWEGRRLTKYYVSSIEPYNVCTYTYNDDGIRTSKTVDGVTHTYYLSGSQIIAEGWENKLCLFCTMRTEARLGCSTEQQAWRKECCIPSGSRRICRVILLPYTMRAG